MKMTEELTIEIEQISEDSNAQELHRALATAFSIRFQKDGGSQEKILVGLEITNPDQKNIFDNLSFSISNLQREADRYFNTAPVFNKDGKLDGSWLTIMRTQDPVIQKIQFAWCEELAREYRMTFDENQLPHFIIEVFDIENSIGVWLSIVGKSFDAKQVKRQIKGQDQITKKLQN